MEFTTADPARGVRDNARLAWRVVFAVVLLGATALVIVRGDADRSTATPAAAPGVPGVAGRAGGATDVVSRVALLDVDGRVVLRPGGLSGGPEMVLATAGPGESLGGLAAGPDGDVYFHRVTAGDSWCGISSSVEVVRDGAASAHVLAAGHWPGPNAAGTRLAYAAPPACAASADGGVEVEHALVVREVAGGGERRWRWEQPQALGDDAPGWPTAAAWIDDRVLAYGRNLAGGDAGTVWTLDTGLAGTDLGGTDLGPAPPDSWWDPTFDSASRRLLVIEPRYDSELGAVTSAIVAIDPSAPDRREVVARSSHEIVQVDADPSTGDLLLVERVGDLLTLRHHRAATRSTTTVATGVAEAVFLR